MEDQLGEPLFEVVDLFNSQLRTSLRKDSAQSLAWTSYSEFLHYFLARQAPSLRPVFMGSLR